MPFNEQHQSPGNPIPAAGWNSIVDEIKRLGEAKIDTTGDIMSGPLTLQKSLSVAGGATLGAATVNGAMSVAGQTSLGNGATVNGTLAVAGTTAVTGTGAFGDLRVGPGAGAPKDTLEVAGNFRMGTSGNPIRFTSVWSAFPDSTTNQAEICNSVEPLFRCLMIVGNKSKGDGNRTIGMWDKLEVHGQSCANSFCNLSDGRLKTDVATITDPLEQVARLRGVSFRWDAGADEAEWSPGTPHQSATGAPFLGVIAQEVAEVFPSLVSTMGSRQQLGVDYNGLTAVLIEAIKELKAENEGLRRRVQALELDGSGPG